MKPRLVAVAAVLAMTAVPPLAPALADNGQIMRDPQSVYLFDYRLGQNKPAQCFNGRMIAGINRLGQNIFYVQARTGVIYELTVPRGCPAMEQADKVQVTASGGDYVCKGEEAEMFARRGSGSTRCFVSTVRQLRREEIDALAQAIVR